MTRVAFELDLSSGKVRDVRDATEPAPLRDAFTWSVTCVDDRVRVYALGRRGLELVGRATLDPTGTLRDRVGAGAEEPNDYQWGRVVDGLGVALGRNLTVAGPRVIDAGLRRHEPKPRPVASPAPGPALASPGGARSHALLVGPVVVGLIVIGVGVLVYASQGGGTRTPPVPVAPAPAPRAEPPAVATDPATPAASSGADAAPTPEEAVLAAPSLTAAAAVIRDRLDERAVADGAWLLARYASGRATWADFHVADAETSLPLALKDGARERGKRLCVTGRLLDIARSDLDQRPVYAGALVTADGDTLRFVAVGSTGTLVKRDTGTFCGVVTGRVDDAAMAVGMFDLPENARPIVER